MMLKRSLMVLVPVLAMGACTTLSDQDRALLTSASQNAEQAKILSQQALDAAKAAQATAATAAKSSDQAAKAAAQAADAAAKAETDAKAANEKADRIFQHSLRKVTPAPQ
jgi:hypothetical protein